jgi:ATP-binding cassette, subfamily B, bacterial
MRFPFYRQHDSNDCGPACLRIIIRYYGKGISIQKLRILCQTNRLGTNLLGISEAAESLGLKSHPVQLDTDTLITKVNLPTLLFWDQKHFVVLYKVRKNKIFIADPAKGLISLSKEEFKKHWQNKDDLGIALLLEPTTSFYSTENLEDYKAEKLKISSLYHHIYSYKKLILQLFYTLLISTTLQLIFPFLSRSIVDIGINTSNISFIYVVLLAQLMLLIGRLVVDFMKGWILLHISTRINLSIITDFLIKLLRLPMSFYDNKSSGDILQRMSDNSRIEYFLTGPSLNTFFSFFNLLIFSFVLASFNLTIFYVFVLSSILYSVWVLLFLKKRKELDYKRFDLSAKEQNATFQIIYGMAEIKIYGIERVSRWMWEGIKAKLFNLSVKTLSLNQFQQTGAFLINESKNIFITFLSAKLVIEGQMTLGTMLAVQYLIGQLNSPIEQLIGFVQSWQSAKISIERLNEVHNIQDEEPINNNLLKQLPVGFLKNFTGGRGPSYDNLNDPEFHYYNNNSRTSNGEIPEIVDGSPNKNVVGIRLENIYFAYPGAGNDFTLKDLNLFIPKGKVTAIVGTSGSGKTTLLKLLLRFHDPIKGQIRVDNTQLMNISHKVWRSHCGVVMQESYIFSDSIANNIALSEEPVNFDKLYHAAKIANLIEFIESLPLGFETKIGEQGIGVSMGQKQRILIARAVYRNPQFIFFDEATNSLDANNETIIISNLQKFFKDRTVIVVAHRLSTVKNADQIVVLENGKIEECGTHEELINLKSRYYTLVQNQLELGR